MVGNLFRHPCLRGLGASLGLGRFAMGFCLFSSGVPPPINPQGDGGRYVRVCAWVEVPVWARPARQVFTQRGFVAKLLLANSDLADLQTLDTDLTKCLLDMGVGTVR